MTKRIKQYNENQRFSYVMAVGNTYDEMRENFSSCTGGKSMLSKNGSCILVWADVTAIDIHNTGIDLCSFYNVKN